MRRVVCGYERMPSAQPLVCRRPVMSRTQRRHGGYRPDSGVSSTTPRAREYRTSETHSPTQRGRHGAIHEPLYGKPWTRPLRGKSDRRVRVAWAELADRSHLCDGGLGADAARLRCDRYGVGASSERSFAGCSVVRSMIVLLLVLGSRGASLGLVLPLVCRACGEVGGPVALGDRCPLGGGVGVQTGQTGQDWCGDVGDQCD